MAVINLFVSKQSLKGQKATFSHFLFIINQSAEVLELAVNVKKEHLFAC